ncbi:alpha/beta-hydrolase [Daedalea quercina L-15889]|uniref:Alpha/beta-hydrolase n=1 Tax=Daedalea quercina L-15889 TaxID=1314783 RepID=A0A165LM29_9APHY|nr:alpha/beta-hydrolase [Daedalea quercina L-15889]
MVQTVTYSRVGSLEIKLDIELPAHSTSGSLPAVIYAHGGGLVCGSRRDVWLPEWFRDSVLKRGFIFISPDYRLIPPCTGFDIIEDIKALFRFLADPAFSASHLPEGITLDVSRLAIAGFSGGGYPARAAGLYAKPRPKAVLLFFGMGGDMLTDHWVAVKDKPMPIFGDAVPPEDEMQAMLASGFPPESDAPFVRQPDGSSLDVGRRWHLFPYWYRKGEFLDHVVGEPVSATLRALPPSERAAAVPAHLRPAVLETQLDATFPPTFLIHGTADRVVLLSESQVTYDQLKKFGVETEIVTVPDADHALLTPDFTQPADGAAEAQEKAIDFLERVFRA